MDRPENHETAVVGQAVTADISELVVGARVSAGPGVTRTPGYRWVVLGVATFAQAASCFFVQGIGALSLDLRADLGLSATRLGLLLSASQLVPLLGLSVAASSPRVWAWGPSPRDTSAC
jgi:hypothetical protein